MAPTAATLQVASVMPGIPGHIGQDGMIQLSANARRPYLDPRDGQSYVIVPNGRDDKGNAQYSKVKVNATALLQYEEWLDIDRAVIAAALQRLVGIADLQAMGLEHTLGSIGQTISLWDRQSSMTPAEISMSAVTRGEKDTPAYSPQQVPVPIVHKEFGLELRRLEASRRFGESLDVTGAAIAGRNVAEKSESMLFSGAAIQVNGATIYGYINHPDRNTVVLSLAWDNASKTGAQILADVAAMLASSRGQRHFGPFILYVPTTYQGPLEADYRAQDPRTVKQRLLALDGIEDVKVGDFLPANTVVLVQMTSDVVDLAIAQDITTVQWSVLGGMQEEFKVMAIWVPRIKSDFDGRSGVTVLS